MPTGTVLLTDMLKTMGVVSSGEAPTSGELDDALTGVNRMLDASGVERLTCYTTTRTTKTLTSGTSAYTIGTGGSINVVRPVWLDAAGIILDTTASPTTEIPISVYTLQEYERLAQKGQSGSPARGIYYDKAWTAGFGTINVYPVPAVSTTQLVLYVPTALTALALATTYTFPPGYESFLHWNGAMELLGLFNTTQDRKRLIEFRAKETRGNIKRANYQPKELRCDPALTQGYGSGSWDIESGI
jgi:hypothetical protein